MHQYEEVRQRGGGERVGGAVIYRLFNKHFWGCPGGLPPRARCPGASSLRSRVGLPLRPATRRREAHLPAAVPEHQYETALELMGKERGVGRMGPWRGSVTPATWDQPLQPQCHTRESAAQEPEAARGGGRPPVLSGAPALPAFALHPPCRACVCQVRNDTWQLFELGGRRSAPLGSRQKICSQPRPPFY